MTRAARHLPIGPLVPLGALLAGLLVGLLAGPGAARAQTVRLAVVAGNDRGGERRASLRYAEADARRVAGLLVELGGFEPGRVRLVLGGGPDDVLDALAAAEAELARDGSADGLLLFYYSGHADGVALELGRERLPFALLRERLQASRARIKLGLLDACQSGALTGTKGGRPAPAFELEQGERLEAEGTAFLTSSAAGELSQESAEVQGSFFTTYLLSGLRGAADLDGDRRVTLAEVYQYAYERTLEDTARTLAGPQHPTYEMRLTGRGGVVLSDLTLRRSALLLGPELAGELLVLSSDGGQVVGEVRKALGERRRLALPAGAYRVALRRGGRVLQAELGLVEGQELPLVAGALQETDSLVAAVKGSSAPRGPLGLYAAYGLGAGALEGLGVVHQGVVGLRWDLGPVSLLPRLSYGESAVDERLLRYRLRLLSGLLLAAWRFELAALDLFAGLGLGGAYGRQSMPDGSLLEGGLFTYQALVGLDLPLWEGLSAQVFWLVGGHLYQQDGQLAHRLALEGSLGLGYQF